jgi:hypothetical protein
VVVEYRCSIPSLIFFAPTQLSILIQWSSNIVTPSLPLSLSSLPNSPYLISCRRISLPHRFPHLFRPYPTHHTYSVVVEYRCPITSLIFFVPTQLSMLNQWSSNIVTPSLPSSFSSLPNRWGNDNRRPLIKYGELGGDEKDKGRDGVTIFDDH